MAYPKLSELKATKGLSRKDLSIKTSIYITGGFLDKAFCDVLDHYLKTVKFFLKLSLIIGNQLGEVYILQNILKISKQQRL